MSVHIVLVLVAVFVAYGALVLLIFWCCLVMDGSEDVSSFDCGKANRFASVFTMMFCKACFVCKCFITFFAFEVVCEGFTFTFGLVIHSSRLVIAAECFTASAVVHLML